MKTSVKSVMLLIVMAILTACHNEEPVLGNYDYCTIFLSIENESGEDLTRDIDMDKSREDCTDCPSYSGKQITEDGVKHLPYIGPLLRKRSGMLEFVTYVFSPYYELTVRLFEDDTEDIIFTGTETKLKKDWSYKWEYKGIKLPITEDGNTNVTLIRHNDGTYYLKE